MTVAPGADWALMAALTLCFNDCLNEPRPTGGGRWRRKSKGAEDWAESPGSEDGPSAARAQGATEERTAER